MENFLSSESYVPAGNYLFKVNNKNIRARCEIYSTVPIVNFEQVNTGCDVNLHFSLMYHYSPINALPKIL